MFRVSTLKTVVRVASLVFLLVASMGPWFADSHPATEESCARTPPPGLHPFEPVLPHLVWLGDGYCACLITIKNYVVGALYGRDVMWPTVLPLALPVLTTLLLLLFGERRWLRVGHLSAWGIAGIYAWLWFGGVWIAHQGVLVLWGAGLGGVVAVAILVGETLIAKRQFSMNQREELS